VVDPGGARARPGDGLDASVKLVAVAGAEVVVGEQRAASEAYVASQSAEGWLPVPDRYDDGGVSGATLERPALKRLLADIEAEKIDCVVVYKVDRLSRSLP
jgi:DNA invertase Pin-like site-specific DNA recombinase